MCLVILAAKKKEKSVFEVWLSVLTGALFLCGWPCTIQRVFSNNKGFTSKLCLKPRIMAQNEKLFPYLQLVLPDAAPHQTCSFHSMTLQPLECTGSCCPITSFPETHHVASEIFCCKFFFFLLLQSSKLFVLFCDEHKLMTPPLICRHNIFKRPTLTESLKIKGTLSNISNSISVLSNGVQRNIDKSPHSAFCWNIFFQIIVQNWTETPTPEAESLTCWHTVAVTAVKPCTVACEVFRHCHMIQMHNRT